MSELYSTFAALYDAAFDWDVEDQVSAIAGLSGLTSGRVLEPMCGSGRLLRGFAAAGFKTVGIDRSREMLSLAEAAFDRMGLEGEWLQADVRRFDLDEGCQLAVCPINSLAHLETDADMLDHLASVSRNLVSGASYWVQLDLKAPGDSGAAESWEFEYEGQVLLSEWACTGASDGYETHVSRFVFPDGNSIEESYRMRVWSYDAWEKLLARSTFELSGAYEGGAFAPLPLGRGLDGEHVFWQQLVKLPA